MTKMYELIPQYDARRSFYGKAKIEETKKYLKLYSYQTLVAMINKEENTVKVFGTYSPTTLRHIKEFLKQNNFIAINKKQIEDTYI